MKICTNCVEFKDLKERRVELEVEKFLKQEMVDHHEELQGEPDFSDDAVNNFLEVSYEVGDNSISQVRTEYSVDFFVMNFPLLYYIGSS